MGSPSSVTSYHEHSRDENQNKARKTAATERGVTQILPSIDETTIIHCIHSCKAQGTEPEKYSHLFYKNSGVDIGREDHN